MITALYVKNKLGFMMAQSTDHSMMIRLCSTCGYNIVISWILNSVFKEISASIIFADSVFQIWLDLKDRFQRSNGVRIFQSKQESITLSQGQSSIIVYITKLKAIWEELNNFRPHCFVESAHACHGVKNYESHHQLEYVMLFLMGLSD